MTVVMLQASSSSYVLRNIHPFILAPQTYILSSSLFHLVNTNIISLPNPKRFKPSCS